MNEYEGGIAYRRDSGPERRLYIIILAPYQVCITPRRTERRPP